MDDITTRLLYLAAENPNLPVVYVTDDRYTDEYIETGCAKACGVRIGYVCLYRGCAYTDKGEFIDDYYNINEDALTDMFNYDSSKAYEYIGGKQTLTDDKDVLNAMKMLDEYLDGVVERAFHKAIIVTLGAVDGSFIYAENERT